MTSDELMPCYRGTPTSVTGVRAALAQRAILASGRTMSLRAVDGEKYISPWPRVIEALDAGSTVELYRWQIPLRYRPPGALHDRLELGVDDHFRPASLPTPAS